MKFGRELSYLFVGLLVAWTGISVVVIDQLYTHINELKVREPIIIYTVDNAGGNMIGKVTDKKIIDGAHTIEVGAYGLFLVTPEQYEEINVGDEAPEFLKKRGS